MGKCCMYVSILLLQPEGATYKNVTFTEVYWISTPNTTTADGLMTFFSKPVSKIWKHSTQ